MTTKTLKPFNLYGQNIDFIVKEGGKIESKSDLNDFLNDNFELLQLIYNHEDDLIKVGKGAGLHDGKNVHTLIKKLYGQVKNEGCGFDEKTYNQKDFYEMPIIEFKKLFN